MLVQTPQRTKGCVRGVTRPIEPSTDTVVKSMV